MRCSLVFACLAVVGCGGIRIGTDETVGAVEPTVLAAIYRSRDFVRFPGDSDSIVLSRFVERSADLVVPAWPRPLLLSIWSRDSSEGAWVRDPASNFPALHASTVVSIDLSDSVNHATCELSVVGTAALSAGIRLDSNRIRYRVRSPGGIATLALRWSVANAKRMVYIDSVDLDRDRTIDVSRFSGLLDGTRVRLDGAGEMVVGTSPSP